MLFKPYERQRRLRAEHGEVVRVRMLSEELVMLTSTDAAKQVFGSNPVAHFRPYGSEILGPFLGMKSVFLLSGTQHRRERSIIMPPFARKRMAQYSDLIMESAREQAEKWEGRGEIVLMDEHLNTTLTIILKAVFGVQDEARMELYHEGIAEAVDSVKPWLMFFEFLQRDFGGVGPWANFKRRKAVMDAMLYEDIAKKRAGEELGDDILSILVQSTYEDGSPLPDDVVRDHLVSLLIAGHETTSIALSNAMAYLYERPDVLMRLRDELDESGAAGDAAAIVKLPFLDAVVSETLRLNPIVPAVARLLRKPMTFGEFTIPAGEAVAVAICAIHFDPELYPEPDRFKPERFLERRFGPHEYMPFGGGHRRCVGATLALHEMKLVLAELLSNWEFELAEPEPVSMIRRNVVMAPSTGVRMRVLGRRQAN